MNTFHALLCWKRRERESHKSTLERATLFASCSLASGFWECWLIRLVRVAVWCRWQWAKVMNGLSSNRWKISAPITKHHPELRHFSYFFTKNVWNNIFVQEYAYAVIYDTEDRKQVMCQQCNCCSSRERLYFPFTTGRSRLKKKKTYKNVDTKIRERVLQHNRPEVNNNLRKFMKFCFCLRVTEGADEAVLILWQFVTLLSK